MGKKTNTTSNQSAASDGKDPAATKPKRSNGKATAKKRSTLTEKAVKAVAAVALGVGGAIAAKKKTRSAKKSDVPAADATPVAESAPIAPAVSYTREDIALRAYYISENRRAAGLSVDPHQDWLDAEKELAQERRRQTA